MFNKCRGLKEIKGINNFKTSNVLNMKSMFQECNDLISLDLSNFDTTKVKNMSKMFSDCYELKSLNLSNFNTLNVTDMEEMFYKCYSLKEIKGINNFNIVNVINMKDMFEECFVLKDIDLNKFNNLNINNKEEISQSESIKKEKRKEENETPNKLITIYFSSTDQSINYTMACFNKDIFSTVEQKLILQFPDLKDKNIYYLVNGNVVNRSISLEENKIKNNDHLLINYFD